MSHRDKKAVEADTKAIVGYLIDSHFLLNLHMIYKNVSTTRSGIAYLECMKFMNLVLTHEPLQKLLRDYVKHPQYKESIMEAGEILGIAVSKSTSKKDRRLVWT